MEPIEKNYPTTTTSEDDRPGEVEFSFSFFFQNDDSRPLGLEVEDKLFWVPKDGLCAYSPVFKNMLYGQFAEANPNRKTVKLPGKRPKDVDELLMCLFPTPIVKKIDDQNVDLLLDFADEYEIADLASRCSDFLQQKLDQLSNGDEKLIDVLVLASKHRLRRILFRVVDRCADCFDLEKFQSVFDRLSSEVLGALAWYKCQRQIANSKTTTTEFLLQQEQQRFATMCNNCRNGHTQNRCTVCGGAQKCPLCNAVPRRSRPCSCANLIRGSSMAILTESSSEAEKNEVGKTFDGACALLKRL